MRAAKGKGRLWAAPAAVLLLLVAGVVSPAAASLPAVTPPPEASAHALALALHAEAPAGESEASPAAGGPASSGEAAVPAAAASPHFSLLGRVHQGLGIYPLERVPSDAPSLSKTRVWGSDEKTTPSSRLEAELSRRLHRGYGFAYDGIASDPCEYDYKGLRVLKQGALGFVHYAYDDKSVLVETDASGVILAKYDYGPDRLLSQTQQTEGRSFYLFDALGSVTDLSTASGTLRATYQYDAWGNDRATTGGSFNAFGFTGHERDGETGLYYFKARFYDPAAGRFLSEDPADGQANNPPSLHRYLYAYVNPTVYTDPYGWAPGDWWDPRSYADVSLFSAAAMKRSWTFLKAEGKGFVKAPVELAKGLAHASAHPVDAIKAVGHGVVSAGTAIGQAVTYPINAVKSAAKGVDAAIEHFANETTEQQGQAVGAQLFYVAAGGAASRGASVAAKVVSEALDFSGLGEAAFQGIQEGVEEGVAELTPKFEIPTPEAAPPPPPLADAGGEAAKAASEVAAKQTLRSATLAESADGAGVEAGTVESTQSATAATDGSAEGQGVLFGQKRVSPSFSMQKGVPPYLKGRPILDVAADLRTGALSSDDLPVEAFANPSGPGLVSANTRSLAALSEAGLRPTNIRMIEPTEELLQRLAERPVIPGAHLPGPRVPMTPSKSDLAILHIFETPP